jgi:hypothetical protein
MGQKEPLIVVDNYAASPKPYRASPFVGAIEDSRGKGLGTQVPYRRKKGELTRLAWTRGVARDMKVIAMFGR